MVLRGVFLADAALLVFFTPPPVLGCCSWASASADPRTAIRSVTVPPRGSTRDWGAWGRFDSGEPGFDDFLQSVVVLVVLDLDMEVLGDGGHQRPGELDLLGAQLDALGVDAGRGADLVGP